MRESGRGRNAGLARRDPLKLLLGTRSEHKVREVARILETAGFGGVGGAGGQAAGGRSAPRAAIELVTPDQAGVRWSPKEDDLEPHATFAANAESKARYYARLTGLPTVADDSGLAVDALGGRPGVRSKRFAPPEGYPGLERDEANNRHLLELLGDVPAVRRGAGYVCVACLVTRCGGAVAAPPGACPDRTDADPIDVRIFRGECRGWILSAPRGTGGFGYDPLFGDEASGRSFGELTADEKHARSHRGRAFRALAEWLTLTTLGDTQ